MNAHERYKRNEPTQIDIPLITVLRQHTDWKRKP